MQRKLSTIEVAYQSKNMNISRSLVELVSNIEKTIYNMKKRASNSCIGKTRCSPGQELPLPIYIGLSIHQVTRRKKLIQQVYQIGIYIS